jgi:hypothetical protein
MRTALLCMIICIVLLASKVFFLEKNIKALIEIDRKQTDIIIKITEVF